MNKIKHFIVQCWSILLGFNAIMGLFSLGIWWGMSIYPIYHIYSLGIPTNIAEWVFYLVTVVLALNIVHLLVSEQ